MIGSQRRALALLILSPAVLFFAPGISAADPAAGADYEDLVTLFEEFREFQEPVIENGVPDYTAAAMKRQRHRLKVFQDRLAAFDIRTWPVSWQIDYHLVRAEMNGFEFYHRVLRPWSRDPAFYLMTQGGAGPAMSGFYGLWDFDPAMSGDQKAEYKALLEAVPKIYEQVRTNLTEGAHDLAIIAVWAAPWEAEIYTEIGEMLSEHHPDLVPLAKAARLAVEDYGRWVEKNMDRMTAPAGIGKENYNWWLRNVHLSTTSWEEAYQLVQREYDRLVTFLVLEEHRNRELPPLPLNDTEETYYASLDQALNYVVEFLRDEEILTVPDWLDPADYSDPNEPRRPLPTDTSIDHNARVREILPGETHEFIGHLFDEQRQERDERPIRGAGRRFNMDWMRSEGWAVALEELLMQAGVLDQRQRRGREVEYLMNISHISLSLPDLKMHANEITFDESRELCAAIMAKGWSKKDERMVWYEMESNLRFPGFHTGVVVGKAQYMRLLRERAMQLGNDFNLKEFNDQFLAAGMIPMSLIRWEITGYDDEIKELWDGHNED
jgi:hypothetical protein